MQQAFGNTGVSVINIPAPYIISKSVFKPTASKSAYYDMVVFSHIRWENMDSYHRNIISHMAENCRLLFIEEPVLFRAGEKNTGNIIYITENLRVLQPRVHSIADIIKILPQFIACRHIKAGWFYSAAFAPLLKVLAFDKVVYDCIGGQPAARVNTEHEKYLRSVAYVVLREGAVVKNEVFDKTIASYEADGSYHRKKVGQLVGII